MTIRSLCNDMLIMAVFLLIGYFVRERAKPLQRLFLPASLIGGVILLAVGQQGAGLLTVPKSFNSVPGVLIDLVMASLIFGVTINREKMHSYFDYMCVPMTTYGMQMCVGTLLGALLMDFWPGLPLGWGVMGVFSFHGGHGTAAAAASSFDKLGIEGNMAVGMVLSTVGLIIAMVVGMAIVNYGVRRGWGTFVKEPTKQPDYFYGGILSKEQQKSVGHLLTTSISINHLALQSAWLLASLFLGQIIFKGLGMVWHGFDVLPSVLHGVIGGAVMWKLIQLLKLEEYVDMKMIKLISGFLLEIVVFTAMATLNLKFISTYAAAIGIYSIVIVILTVPLILLSAYCFCKEEWFEKAVMAFGAATGNTSTGLALIRAIDPNSESSAGDSHGVYATVMSWKDAFVGLAPMWLMSGVTLTAGVGLAIMISFAVVGFMFFYTKRKVFS